MVLEGFLEVTEQTAGTRNAEHHTVQLTQDLLPLEQRDAFLGQRYGGKYVLEAGYMMRGEQDSLAYHHVNEPP